MATSSSCWGLGKGIKMLHTKQSGGLNVKGELCEECHILLHPKVADYSWHRFGRPLCINCQKLARLKENSKLGKFINDQIERKYAGKDLQN